VSELSTCNIRINAISPGFFPTDMTKGANTAGFIDEVARKIPLGFVPKLSDLDGAVLYLASNKASSYVTGSIITVDGGISCRS
jgi:NAD(P)-dependent dehydrogenase (short-subunit alcohol dehydrogenase family)